MAVITEEQVIADGNLGTLWLFRRDFFGAFFLGKTR